ncbi:MAG: hypothetical protein KC493_08785, partial [Bacteriovoracaceae bacterium]|nr:hypothetical protein [Bacteriovoracaceae bacterium]
MKKRNVFSGLILTLMFCGEVNAQVINFVGNGSNRVGGNSSTSRTISTDAQRGQTDGLYTTCKGPDYMKLSYLRNLFSEPEAFKVSINESQTSLEIEYPEFIGNCMELKFDVQYINNNAVVKAFNEKFSTDYDAEGRIVKSSFQKYLDCLKVEGILTNVGTDAEPSFQFNANHTNVSRISASRVSMPIRDGALDRGKDVKAYFLSPKSVTTGAFAPAFEVSKPSYDNTCYYTERANSNENNIVYMSPASRARQSVYEACVSKNYKRILSALRNLDSNTVGNYKLLKDTLEKALIKSLEGESDKVYEQMRALAKDVEFDDKGEPNIDSEDSVDLLEDYADILRDLNRKVLTPYISRIDDLLTERAKAKTREEKRAIDKLIKQYKDKIKQYSKRANTLGYNKMMKLARYYGHTGEGRGIEGFRLKSHIYGHMKESIKHPTKNRKIKISFKKAGEVINDALDHFDDKVASVWEKEAASRRGDATAALSARGRHQSLTKARDQRYRSDMQNV